MKKRWIISVIVLISLVIYFAGYYSARKDKLLVRHLQSTYENGEPITTFSIGPGRFGPGKGGILVSQNEVAFCMIAFTPLRKLEEIYWNNK